MADKLSFEEEFEQYMDAGLPILFIDTLENGKMRDTLAKIADRRQYGVVEWSLHGGLRDVAAEISQQGDLISSLDILLADKQSLSQRLLIIEDIGGEFENPKIISRLRYLAEQIEQGNIEDCTVILLAPLGRIPRELEPYITLLNQDYLDAEEIKQKIKEFTEENGCRTPVDELMENLAMSLRGLSETEIDNILALALVTNGQLDKRDLPVIFKQKQQMIKKSGILEMVTVKESLDDIGGLENLKEWLRVKADIFQNVRKAKAFGVDIPKGVLIAGMPGCGKSLTAKAAAKTFNIPLLRMDMGRLMGKYVGESEGNMRRAIQLTEASSPCVLWIDELEKAFAGVQQGGGGSEITTRLFGSFLTWMQEKDSLAFVVATANDISKLPPELMRKGRFDEIFYVDLPNEKEREKILEIHINKRRKGDLQGIDVSKLVKDMAGYCGADIEGVVASSVEAAFVAKKERLTTEDIKAAIARTHPISETMKKQIDNMKKTYEEKKLTNASA